MGKIIGACASTDEEIQEKALLCLREIAV